MIIEFSTAARKHRRRPVSPTLADLRPLWLADRHADNRRPRGVQNYDDVFGRFLTFAQAAGAVTAGDVSEDLVKDYKRHLMSRVAPGTARHALTVVRTFLEWCVRERYLAENVALRVPHPTVEEPNPDPLSTEQIALLLALCDRPPRSHKATWRRNRRAIFLMLYAGLRLAEVAGLEWRDVDLGRRLITVRREIAKGGRPRVVPICDELAEELAAAGRRSAGDAVVDQGDTPEGRGVPLTDKSLAHVFERWVAGRGLVIHAHQLRKTFATELYLRGEDITTIQRLLGHKDPKTTTRYIGASSAKERAAVMKLTFRQPAVETMSETGG